MAAAPDVDAITALTVLLAVEYGMSIDSADDIYEYCAPLLGEVMPNTDHDDAQSQEAILIDRILRSDDFKAWRAARIGR